MKTQIKRTLLLLFIAIITAAAAVMVIMTTTGYDYDAQPVAASPQDAQLTVLTAENAGIKQVAASVNHTMVLFNNGKLYATGYNDYGQLGLGDNVARNSFTLVESLSGKSITSVVCSLSYSMVIADGKLYGTGRNDYGQLGLGDTTARNTFTEVTATIGNKTVTSIVCGYYHSMVIADGKLYGTGRNDYGQLGLGDNDRRNTFTEVTATIGNKTVTSVACGCDYSMVMANGKLYSVGYNNYGQLGLGDTTARNIFSEVMANIENKTVTSVACGYYHSMVIADGKLYSIGLNGNGQLGLGNTINRTIFAEVTATIGNKELTSVECGSNHTMVIADGRLYSVGYNIYGQLGLGDKTARNTFTEVPLNYTIKYESNGGTLIDNVTPEQTMPYHITTELQANPFAKDGCTFAGWATSQSDAEKGIVTYTDKQAVTYLAEIGESITLYAVWQPDAFELTFNASAKEMTFDGKSHIELSADHTEYDNLTYTYKWLYKGEEDAEYSEMPDATERALKLQNAKQSGTYKVEVTAAYQALSATTTSGEQEIKIYRASLSPKLDIEGWTYGIRTDQVPKPQLEGNIGGGEVTYYYEGTTNGGEEYAKTTVVPTQAGTYKLSVAIEATDNTYSYATPSGKETEFTIGRAEITPTVKFPDKLTYNGRAIADPAVTNVSEDPKITFWYKGTTNGGAEYDSATPPIDAGTYTVTVTIGETNNYAKAEVPQAFTIARAKPDVTPGIVGWVYGDTPNNPALNGNYEYKEEVTYTYSGTSNNGTVYPESSEAPTEAGDYTVTAKIGEKANYEAVETTFDFTIAKATLTDLAVSLNGWTYGETPGTIEPLVLGNEGGGNVSYVYEKQNSNGAYDAYTGEIAKAPVGIYRVTALVDATSNYNGASTTGLFTIAKGQQAPAVTVREEWTYGDALSDPTVTGVKDGGQVTYLYSGTPNDGTNFATGSSRPTKAGKYTVTVTIAATENYAQYSKAYDFVIAKKTIAAPWIDSKVYTGNKQAAGTTGFATNLYSVENAGGVEVGKYPVVLTLKDAYNYTWETESSAELTLWFYITQNANKWTTEPGLNVDGTGKITYGDEISPSMGSVTNGTVNVTYWYANGQFIGSNAPTKVGQYKAVFTVDASESYTGLYKEVPFEIVAKKITVTLDDKTSEYGKPFKELTYDAVVGLVDGDTEAGLKLKLTKASGETVGEYAITGMWDNANYDVTFINGTYTIEKATYNTDGITFDGLTVTYDGNAHNIAIKGDLPEGVSVRYTHNGGAFNGATDAGTYTIKAVFTGDAYNYNAIEDMTATLTIEKADYDMSGVTFEDTEITYDGKSHTLEITGTLPTGKDGIQVTVTYNSDGNITVTDVEDGTVTITATYATTSMNYRDPQSWVATLKIVAKELTEDMFVVGEGPYVYDGSQKTPTVTVNASETTLLAENYTVDYGENVNAGKGTITVTGSGNYCGSVVLDFDIEQATFDPTVTIKGWKYNGTPNDPVVGNNVSGGECTYVYKGTSNGGTPYASSNAPVKAGKYTVTVTIAATDNYKAATATSEEFEIERAAIEPELTLENWTYGQSPSMPVLVGNNGNGKVTLTYTGTGNNGTAYREKYNELAALGKTFGAGDAYTLEVIIAETDNYAAATVKVPFAINRMRISAPGIKPSVSNGDLQKADVSETQNYTVSVNDGGYERGEYPVVLELKDPANTEWSEGNISGEKQELLTLTFMIIGNANSWTTEPSVSNVNYGEEVSPYYAAAFGDSTVTITYYDKDGNLLDDAPTAAGHYTVRFTVEGTIDYTGLDTEIEFDILPKEVTVTIGDKGHVYGEPEAELAWSIADGSIEEGDELQIVLTRESGTNAGTYAIKGTWNNGNYAVTFVEGKYTITKAKYDMNNVEFAGDVVTYDGKMHGLEVTGLPAGVSVTYRNNDQTNAGEYEVTATFTAEDTTNYEALAITELTAVLNIEKAVYDTSSLEFAGDVVTYDGKVHSLEVTGLPAGVSVTYKNNGKTNAGEYEVTATFTGDANHEAIGDMTATLKIEKAKYDMRDVEFADKKVTYNGKEHRIEVTGLPAGVSVEYAENNKTNAGEYTVTATFTAADTTNYEELETKELSATLTIGKAKYNTDGIKFDGSEVTYNGEIHSLYVEGLPAGVSVTYINNDKRNAGTYEVKAVFTGDENYETIETKSATLKIGKAKYDVSGVEFAGKDVTYNGETHSLYVDGLPAGVSVKYVGNDKRNAGTYEVTAVFTVDENHEAIGSMTSTLKINKAKYALPMFEDVTVTYDGESHSLKVTGVPYGVTVEYEGNGKTETGTYTVVAKFTCDANYEAIGDLTATLTILEKGGCGSVVLDGVTIAGIAISVLAFATFLAIRKAKSKKK